MAKLRELNTNLQEQVLDAKSLDKMAGNANCKANKDAVKALKKRLTAKLSDDQVNVIDIYFLH